MSTWSDPYLNSLFKNNTPLIDVRAPVEHLEGSIPGSVNLPIMNDEERKAVGTCYKEKGQAAAIELGHSLVTGKVKEERVRLWSEYIEKNPSVEVFCFRGGLRSQISCQWITEAGFNKKPIPGGYKRLRNFFLSWLDDAPLSPLVRLGGLTGSGKTRVLQKTSHHIDLEGHANHRGSAFGPKGAQPSQVTFENLIALDLMKLEGKRIVVEDESVTIGKVGIPRRFFSEMRSSPLVILEVDKYERLENIFNDYVKDTHEDFFIANLMKIQKRMGATRVAALAEEIKTAFRKPMEVSNHEGWITTLLKEYYDPLYQKDLRYNEDKIIFQGKEEEVLAFLKSNIKA